MRKIGYKIRNKKEKNKNNAHSCHDIVVAMLRVQGQFQNVEKTVTTMKTNAE